MLILIFFSALAKMGESVASRALASSRLRVSRLLQDLFVSLTVRAMFLIGLLIAIAQLGLQIGPVLAGLGIVGLIIGFALQETLSNFASGVRDQADRILLGIVDKNELVLDDPVLVVPTFPAGRIFSRFHHSALGPKR